MGIHAVRAAVQLFGNFRQHQEVRILFAERVLRTHDLQIPGISREAADPDDSEQVDGKLLFQGIPQQPQLCFVVSACRACDRVTFPLQPYKEDAVTSALFC